MKELVLPKTDQQIQAIVTNPDKYVLKTRRLRQKESAARRARILKSSPTHLLRVSPK